MRTARFEQISSDGHHMSRAGGWNGGGGGPCLMSGERLGPEGEGLYSEVQCIMDNGHLNRMTHPTENINFLGGC